MKTLVLLILCLLAFSPSQDYLQNVLRLSGASSIEELGPRQLEHYENLYEHPLDINRCSLSRLQESELFSDLQLALLLDYRQRCGSLLSLAELAAIPGMGEQFALDIGPFIVLGDERPAQRPRERRLLLKQQMRIGIKASAVSTAFKSELSLEPGLRTLISADASGLQALSLCYEGRRLSKVLAGNFNGRFGQGLLLWSGFSLNSLSSAAAFSKKASLLSPSNSLSAEGSLRGIGAQLSLGRWSLNALATREMAYSYAGCLLSRSSLGAGLMFNENWLGASADAKTTLGKFTLFAEGALQLPLSLVRGETAAQAIVSSALVAGCYYNIGYLKRLALQLRLYAPSFDSRYSGASRAWSKNCDENAIALALDWGGLKMASDWSIRPYAGDRQWKSQLDYSRDFALGTWLLRPALRFQSRIRALDANPARLELRTDLSLLKASWQVDLRLHALHCKGVSGLVYLQVSRSGEKALLSARASVFAVDSWDKRIYAYARDVPGTFSVPAYYGRGCEFALYGRYRNIAFRLAGTHYFRGSRSDGLEFKLYLDMQRFFDKSHLSKGLDKY